jgi:hypothetical protein
VKHSTNLTGETYQDSIEPFSSYSLFFRRATNCVWLDRWRTQGINHTHEAMLHLLHPAHARSIFFAGKLQLQGG